MDRGDALRAGAAALAAGAFAGSFAFVVGHPKNPDAPLQPPAEDEVALRTATPTPRPTSPGASAPARPTARPQASPLPRITLQPGVRATELPGVTYTHVS